MKRVLFIVYYFPPLADSGTQRPLKFSKYLPDFGWHPIILTVDDPPNNDLDVSLLDEVRMGTRVLRVRMLSDSIGDVLGRCTFGIVDRKRVKEGVSWRLREVWHMPDVYALWRPSATRVATKLFKSEGFDAIYATGYPWTSLLIGRDISRATGVPLIADFRDPWVGDELFKPKPTASQWQRHFELESSVVQQAAIVVSTSDAITAKLQTAHSDVPRERFVTITNGFDPADATGGTSDLSRKSLKFRLVYTGVWQVGYGLDALYSIIQELARTVPSALRNFELVAAGFTPGMARRMGIEPWVTELGKLPHRDALALMRTADALFATAPQPSAIASKLFEYLAADRPIVLVSRPDGESARLIKRTGGGISISPDNREELKALLSSIGGGGTVEIPPQDPAQVSGLTRNALTGRLAHLLDRVATAGRQTSQDDAMAEST